MLLSVNKNDIIAGNREQLHSLLHRNFISLDHVAIEQPDDQQRQLYADIIASLDDEVYSSVSNWSGYALAAITDELRQYQPDLNTVLEAELRCNLQVLDRLNSQGHLDHQMAAILQRLRKPLLASAMLDAAFWLSSHPLLALFDLLYQQAMGWQQDLFKYSDALESLYQKIIIDCQKIGNDERDKFAALLQQSQIQLQTFHRRYALLSQRQVASEIGLLKSQQANAQVYHFFHALLNGRKLPAVVANFLQGHLYHELKLLVLREGEQSSQWKLWQTLLKNLIQCYRIQAPLTADPVVKEALNVLPQQLSKAIEQLHAQESQPVSAADNLVYDVFLDQIGFDFLSLSKGDACTGLLAVELILQPSDTVPFVANIHNRLIEHMRGFSLGDWFIASAAEGQQQRCQLAAKLIDMDKMIFTTVTGQTVMILNFRDFADQLSARTIKSLHKDNICQRIFERILDECLINSSVIHEQQTQTRLSDQLRQHREAMAEIQRMDSIRKKAERQKQLAHKKAEKARLQAAQITGELRQQLHLCFESLSLGSCIEVMNKSGQTFTLAQLSDKNSNSGKLTFVNPQGEIILSAHHTQLIDKAMLGQIRLLESDKSLFQRITGL